MTRKIGQVSFNLRSAYESRLYAHATKTEHGEFSKYVKRLIDRDLRAEDTSLTSQITARATVEEIDVTSFL